MSTPDATNRSGATTDSQDRQLVVQRMVSGTELEPVVWRELEPREIIIEGDERWEGLEWHPVIYGECYDSRVGRGKKYRRRVNSATQHSGSSSANQ